MSLPLPVRVAPGVSTLTSGILRAVLYPGDAAAQEVAVRTFGEAMVADARRLLPAKYRRDDTDGIWITDCPVRTAHPLLPPCEPPPQTEGELTPPVPGEFRICPSDHRRHEGAHLYRCQHPDRPEEELLPAFPHGWWPPNDPAWRSTPPVLEECEPGLIRIGFCGLARRPEIRAQAIEAVRSWAEREPRRVRADLVLREKFMGAELNRSQARAEYLDHMQRNLFQVCVRGVGDYCFRLYETLSWGRIPVIVGSRSLPWSGSIDWHEMAVLAPTPEEIPRRVEAWIADRAWRGAAWRQLGDLRRRFWLSHLSPVGWWRRADDLIRKAVTP